MKHRFIRSLMVLALILGVTTPLWAVEGAKIDTSWSTNRKIRKLIKEKKTTDAFEKSFQEIVALGPKAIPVLLEMGKDESLEMHQRWTAIRAVGKIGDLRAVEGLKITLKDPIPTIRMGGLRALGDLKAEEMIPEIREMAETDPALLVRSTAVTTLGQMKSREAIPTLEKVLADEKNFIKGKSLFIRRKAVVAMGDIEERAAAPVLIQALNDKDDSIPPLAVASLERITGMKFQAKAQKGKLQALSADRSVHDQWRSWWEEEYKKIPMRPATSEISVPDASAETAK